MVKDIVLNTEESTQKKKLCSDAFTCEINCFFSFTTGTKERDTNQFYNNKDIIKIFYQTRTNKAVTLITCSSKIKCCIDCIYNIKEEYYIFNLISISSSYSCLFKKHTNSLFMNFCFCFNSIKWDSWDDLFKWNGIFVIRLTEFMGPVFIISCKLMNKY